MRCLLFIPLLTLIACNIHKYADKHIDKRMSAAAMTVESVILGVDTIEYWDNHKEKPVLVLVHGFGASTKYQWFKQIGYLSEHYRVIMPNLLHFGKTNPGTKKYSVADQVQMVESLIRHLKIARYSVCGVSYGGLISLELAVRNASQIDRVVAFDTPVKYMYAEDLNRVKDRFEVESVEELFAPGSEKGLKKLMYLASMKKSIVPASWMTEFYQELYAYNLQDKRMLITELIAGLDEYAAHEYPLEMPVLLLWGSNDPVVPAERGKLLKDHIGENAEYVVIKKGAHMPNLTKTKQFDRVLKSFLGID